MLQIHAFPLPDFAIDLFGSLSPTQGTSKSRPGTPTFVREAFPIGGLTSFQIRDAKMHFFHYALHSSYSALFPFHCSFLSVPLSTVRKSCKLYAPQDHVIAFVSVQRKRDTNAAGGGMLHIIYGLEATTAIGTDCFRWNDFRSFQTWNLANSTSISVFSDFPSSATST